MARQTGKRPAELDGPPIPKALAYVWAWFTDLSNGRGSNGFGPSPLSYQEIAAWIQVTGADPTPWEVGLIRDLDALYLRKSGELAEKSRKEAKPTKPARSK